MQKLIKRKLDNNKDDFNEDEEQLKQGRNQRLFCDTEKNQHFTSYHLYGDLKELDCYLELIHTLHNMQQEDSIKLYIDGPGGYVDTMVQIVNAIECCRGRVIGVWTGNAASAHSFLVLAMPELQVSPRCRMMIHSGTYGYIGKEQEVTSFVTSTDKFFKDFKKEFYMGFLTEQELKDLDSGKDFYFEYPQIVKRLKSRKIYLAKKCKAELVKQK